MSAAESAKNPFTSQPLSSEHKSEPCIHILKDQSIDGIADLITSGNAKNIIVMTGAGISTAAGIKDFRSPGTGLYDDLEKYNLPFPEAVFDLEFFKETPRPFYRLAKHLYPGRYRPTLTHYLLPLLAKKNLLLRSYTQNIDSLERLAGLSEDLMVEAHGSFTTSKCVQCEMTSDPAWVKKHIMNGEIPYCKRCSGLVKPNITFFGENVPSRFSTLVDDDFEKCDLLIVLGTSLKVEPFNRLLGKVPSSCPRLLINREKAGEELERGFDFDGKSLDATRRDALFLGNCDEGVRKLAALCGWEDELQNMHDIGDSKLKIVQEKEVLEFEATEAADQGDDSEKDDHDEDYDSDRKISETGVQDSMDSLDEITHRFERSTLLSLSEDVSQPSEAESVSTKQIIGEEAADSAQEQDSFKASTEGESPSGPNAKEGLSGDDSSPVAAPEEKSLTLESNVDQVVAVSNVTECLDRQEESERQAGCTTTTTTTVAAPQGVTLPIASVESQETAVGTSADEEGVFARQGKAAEDADEGTKTGVLSEDGSPSSEGVLAKASSTLFPLGFPTDVGPGTTHAAFLGSLTSIAAATPSRQQLLFPTYIPMTVTCTNVGADAVVGSGSEYSIFSHSGGLGYPGGGDGEVSNYGYGNRSDGAGISLPTQRRKRRMDFESSGFGGTVKNDRYLRTSAHYQPYVRQEKKRRCNNDLVDGREGSV